MTNPRVTDNDKGEITVALDGQELRGWSYANDGERRQKMLQAREYVEGWCEARDRGVNAQQTQWQTHDTAPKDGQSFYAMRWHGSFENSLHWALFWNGDQFESLDGGAYGVADHFTHWIIPDTSSFPSPDGGGGS